MKQLTARQSKLLILFYVCISKVMMLPSFIVSEVDNCFWILLLAMFCFEFLFVVLVLNVSKTHPNLSFKEMLEKTIGSIATKIIFVLLGSLLIAKLLLQTHETYNYFFDILYTDYQWIYFLFPTFIYLFYVSAKGFKNFGRNIEILGYLIIGCIIVSAFNATPNIKFMSFLPLINGSIAKVSVVSMNACLWFGDFIVLIFMLGQVKQDKNVEKNMIIGYLAGVLISFVICALFFAEYGVVGGLKREAIINITEFIPRLSGTGNFSWVVASLWGVALFFQLGLISFLCVSSFRQMFPKKHNLSIIISGSVVAVSFALLLLTNFSIDIFQSLINSGLKYYFLTIQYIVMLISLIICLFSKQRGQTDV